MRILLDECIDRRLAKEIEGHEVVTVPQAGWAGIKRAMLLGQQAQSNQGWRFTGPLSSAFGQDNPPPPGGQPLGAPRIHPSVLPRDSSWQ